MSIVRSVVNGGGGSSVGLLTGYAVISQALSDATGNTDATAAFTTAYATGKPVFVPPGDYYVTSLPAAIRSITYGAGESSKIHYVGTGVMCSLPNMQRVRFVDLQFVVHNTAGTLFSVSNTFHCSWTRCVFQGQHTTTSGATYAHVTGHIGVVLTGNAGDNLFYDCDFLNLGCGIKTDCIQNGVVGGKFGSCWNHIYGFGGGGMSLAGYIDFLGPNNTGPGVIVDTAINIDGATGQWWLDNVWIEGCYTAIKIGAGSSGPQQFGMTNSKVAATTTCIAVNAARNPTFHNVYFAGDGAGAASPDPFVVDATNAPEGVAFVDSSITGKPISVTSLPLGWVGHTRSGGTSSMRVPNELDMAYGAILKMARSDGTYTPVLRVAGGPQLIVGAPTSNVVEAVVVKDTGNQMMLGLDTVASVANYPALTPAVAGAGPVLAARGTDTNVDLQLTAKGTGQIRNSGATYLANVASTPPTPSGGGVLFVQGGALKFIGSSGTVTTLGPA